MQNINFGTLVRIAKNLVSMALLSTLIACSSSNFPFNPIVEKKVYKPSSSIAVISGDEQDGHVKLAGFITDELTKQSTFQVMSQKEIEKKIPDYPTAILINTKIKEDDEKPIWFPASEKAKLNAIQAKLKVDYIFVVWNRFVERVTVTGQGGSTTDYVYPAGNLIEYPGGKVVASTMSVAGSKQSPLALFRDADYYIIDALKDAAEDIADEFVDVTKSKK
ncbi:MAG: hypothetical protein OEV15_04540 [Gallionella sp.]|nr:hypothetical protein [Gallionella sp.]